MCYLYQIGGNYIHIHKKKTLSLGEAAKGERNYKGV